MKKRDKEKIFLSKKATAKIVGKFVYASYAKRVEHLFKYPTLMILLLAIIFLKPVERLID